MNHATIIPLIGGEALASTEVFGERPEYIMSYSPFMANESHLLNYWNHEVPYFLLDNGDVPPKKKITVVSSVCPCAGLSQYHHSPGVDNPNNQWMEKTANYVLGEMKPDVFWGENAPALVGKIGEFMRDKLRQISLDNDYSMTTYLTKNLNHGVPQYRKRTFYFFWNKKTFGDRVPIFQWHNEPYQKIEDLILGVKSNFQMEPINGKTPSKDDPYYRYLLEVVHGGISHREFFELLVTKNTRGNDAESIIVNEAKHNYMMVAEWMKSNGFEREVPKCVRKHEKLAAGGSIMRRTTIVPKDYIGAFVGHYPSNLTHPHEDRYITYREAMTIMGLPSDFELLNPEKSANHICQNVPFKTAKDMATQVKMALLGDLEFMNTDYMFQSNLNQTIENWNVKGGTLDKFF